MHRRDANSKDKLWHRDVEGKFAKFCRQLSKCTEVISICVSSQYKYRYFLTLLLMPLMCFYIQSLSVCHEIIFSLLVKECPPLNKPDRGDVVPQECQVKPLHGQKCSYECYPGYQAVGANEVTCDDGRWTGSIVHCKGG